MAHFEDLDTLNTLNFNVRNIQHGRFQRFECEDIMTFDIETSNGFLQPNGKAYAFDHQKYLQNPSFYEDAQKVSLMYVWQFAFMENDETIHTYGGRTWDDLKDFLTILVSRIKYACYYPNEPFDPLKWELLKQRKEKRSLRVYFFIHNLGFEFQHLRNLFDHDFSKGTGRRAATFARTMRKPMKVNMTIEGVNVELRDSLVLVQKSLKKWCDDDELPIRKLDEPKDYYLPIRTPATPLTDEEYTYSINDVASMCHGLLKYKQKYETIGNIPLTQTGQVRRKAISEVAMKDPMWSYQCAEISKAYTFDLYKKLRDMFAGGWTHANAKYSNRNLENIQCFDFASSYPAVMTTRTFPLGQFQRVGTNDYDYFLKQDLQSLDLAYHYFIEFSCEDIRAKTMNTWWSSSKTIALESPILDNGKIYRAGSGHFLMTDLDYDTFKKAYDFSNLEIKDMWISEAGLLNKNLILLILEYYGNKTSLKDIEGKESLYNESKQFVNSIYGCAVTRDADDSVIFTPDGWKHIDLTEADFYETMEHKKEDQQFVYYQLGVWVTAWARHNLWEGILALDDKVAYGDTDSIKGLFDDEALKWFDEYNQGIARLEQQVADRLGFDEALYHPKTKKGKEKRLGIFADDGFYTKFKTLGAKRYAYEEDGKVKVTIAGLGKKQGAAKLNDLGGVFAFNSGIVWNTKESEKLTAYYNDNQPTCIFVDRDGNEYETSDRYGICLMPTTFDMSMTEEYEAFVDMIGSGFDMHGEYFEGLPKLFINP